MNNTVKIGAFVGGLAAVFAVGTGLGALTDPAIDTTAAAHTEHQPEPATPGHEDATPAGLQATDRGYSLHLANTLAAPGDAVPLAFHILGPDGAPVTEFTENHEKPLHLIVVRRDLATFTHIHPVMEDDGTWRVDAALTDPGTYRVFADFLPVAADEPLTLGADLHLSGQFTPTPIAPVSATVAAGPFTVALDGAANPNSTSALRFTVTRDGQPVSNLDPYLGAYGHLVALREGDLAYLHVHPEGAPGDGRTEPGPTVVFGAHFPTAGTYRLFLDFSVQGQVHTAAFTLTATAQTPNAGGDHAHDAN